MVASVLSETLLFLAEYELSLGRDKQAEKYCYRLLDLPDPGRGTRLLDLPDPGRVQANALLKEIHARRR